MGKLEPRPLVAGSAPRPDAGPHQPVAGGRPVPDDQVRLQADAGYDRPAADDVLEQILAVLGPERIARAAVAWAILLEPRNLHDGEQIARELALDHAVDHTRQGREATVWSGTYMGVDVQVQAALRSTAGSAQ